MNITLFVLPFPVWNEGSREVEEWQDNTLAKSKRTKRQTMLEKTH